MTPVRLGLAAVVALVFGLAVAGVGMGDAPENDPAPSPAQVAFSKRSIAAGGKEVQEGAKEFEEHHCGTCHALAATGDDGQLGPRMDAQDDPVDEIAENIAEPRKDIKDGYEAKLMPTDYLKEMGPEEIEETAKFISAASKKPGGKEDEDEDGG